MSTNLTRLTAYLARIPDTRVIGTSEGTEDDPWWVMIKIKISSPLAWNIIQELGHVLNYLSVTERLPCVFKPISPAPYLNGGPDEYLRWLIEATEDDASPDVIAESILHALTSERPRTRYPAGAGAKRMLFMRRILPDRQFDKIILRAGGLEGF